MYSTLGDNHMGFISLICRLSCTSKVCLNVVEHMLYNQWYGCLMCRCIVSAIGICWISQWYGCLMCRCIVSAIGICWISQLSRLYMWKTYQSAVLTVCCLCYYRVTAWRKRRQYICMIWGIPTVPWFLQPRLASSTLLLWHCNLPLWLSGIYAITVWIPTI
jgi:hypothetical protein